VDDDTFVACVRESLPYASDVVAGLATHIAAGAGCGTMSRLQLSTPRPAFPGASATPRKQPVSRPVTAVPARGSTRRTTVLPEQPEPLPMSRSCHTSSRTDQMSGCCRRG
jgi:hypothetical protein